MSKLIDDPAKVRSMRIARARDIATRAERYASLRPSAEASAYIRSLVAACNALIDEINRPITPPTTAKETTK